MTASRDQLGLLLNALTEGRITPDQRAALNRLLRDDPGLVDAYLDHLALHSLLRAEFGVTQPIALSAAQPEGGGQSSGFGVQTKKTSAPRIPHAAIALGLAAAIALVATVWLIFTEPRTSNPESSPIAIATVTDVRGDVVFGSDPLTPGDEIAAQTISTDAGSVNLLLRSGASVNLMGPAALRLDTPNRVSLVRGRATFDCPHTAMGFTVAMPDGSRVVDLGTRFEVEVADRLAGRVLVIQGRVELQLPGGERRMLIAGREASLRGGAVRRIQTHRIEPVLTLTPTDDTYVRLGMPDENYGEAHELVVKNAGAASTTRKGYLRFDVSQAHHFVHRAELRLQVRHNDSGGGDPAPNALHFNVYGHHEAAPDTAWRQTTLNWNNAPASDPMGNGVDPARAMFLGTLAVPPVDPAAEPVIVRLGSDALARFLNSDRDGRVSFILTRVEEDGGWNSSFHARESDTGKAPTLVVHNTVSTSTPDSSPAIQEISR